MKKRSFLIVLSVALVIFSFTAVVSAETNRAKLIATVVDYVEQIQRLPNDINDALCGGNQEEYNRKIGELGGLIIAANSAMDELGVVNTMNLWAVYNTITRNPVCGVHDAALTRADWSREELQRIGERANLFEPRVPKMCGRIPFGTNLQNTYMILWNADCYNATIPTLGADLAHQLCYANIIVDCVYDPAMGGNDNWDPIFSIP